MQKLTIIAELGINHNGSLKLAKKLVDKAKDAGADYIKIQNYIPDLIVTKNTPKAKYQTKNENSNNMFAMLKKYHFDFTKTTKLIKYCKKKKIKFLSSPFDEKSFEFLKKKKLKIIKVASGEITNYLLLKKIAQYNKKVILSTGMSDFKEIKSSINFMCKNGQNRRDITLLQCTSHYPTEPQDVNLNMMTNLKKKLKLDIGLSDHTEGFESAICASFIGASVIEKHLTLNKNMQGPDHSSSLDPIEFKNFVISLRNSKLLGGQSVKKATNKEKKLALLARKKVVAFAFIKKNEIFNYQNITVKRSKKGISATKFFKLLFKKAKKNYSPDQPI